MGEEGLHQAAQRRRDRAKAEAAARPSAAELRAVRAVREHKMRQNRIRDALAEAGLFGKIVTNGALVVGLLAPIGISVFVWGSDGFVATALTVVATAVSAFGLYALAEMMVASMRLSRLTRIGRGFDVDGYLDALGENRRHGTVVARATFATPWPDDARASAHDAVMEWMPTLAGVEWAGETLVLRSSSLDGTEWLSGGRFSGGCRIFNNRDQHACVVRIVEHVVPHLEQVAPIAKLAVAIEGPIEAWDADP
jgi:hypothetical protein